MLSIVIGTLVGVNLLVLLFTAYQLSKFDKGNPVFHLLSFAAFTNALLSFIELKFIYTSEKAELFDFTIAYSLIALVTVTFAVQSVFKFVRPILKVKWQIPLKRFAQLALLPVIYLFYELGIQGVDQTESVTNINGIWAYTIDAQLTPAKVFVLYISGSVLIMVNSFWAQYFRGDARSKSRIKKIILTSISCISLVGLISFLYISTYQPMLYIASVPITLIILCIAWVYSNFNIFNINSQNVVTEILDSMSSVLIVSNAKYEIVDVNKAGKKILDQYFKHSIGMPLKAVLKELKIRDWGALSLKDFQKKRSSTVSAEIFGAPVYLNIVISPVIRKGSFEGLTILAMDVTESHLKTIEIEEHARKLESTNKELERFAHIASHDLKTPLRNVVSFLNLIERKIVKYNDSDLKEFTYHARQGASQMFHLIQDVLEYSKVEDEVVNKEEVDLNELLFGVIQKLQPEISEINGELSSCHLPVVQAEAEHMTQLFSHIISNGFKYNQKKKPRVKINYREQEDVHLFAISDNGIGVEKQYYDQIFEMFKRLHTTKTYEGSGIGLSICKILFPTIRLINISSRHA